MPTIISKNLSLLHHFKKIKYSELRIIELENLIKKAELKNYELEFTQLKAIIFLFPQLDRFTAFELLVKHFDIKLSALSESLIKELNACLSRDPAFNNLLPFAKKNFGGIFPAKQSSLRVTPYSIPKKTRDVISNMCKQSMDPKQANNPPAKFANRNRSSLARLRLSFMKEHPEARLNFFNRSETKTCYRALITSMGIEEFKNFLEIFRPHDAIKFMNYSLIKDQIKGFRGQLTSESYSDLLTYFKQSYQKEAVIKLLRPISPVINTTLLKLGTFKEKIITKLEQPEKLPDLVTSHNISRIR